MALLLVPVEFGVRRAPHYSNSRATGAPSWLTKPHVRGRLAPPFPLPPERHRRRCASLPACTFSLLCLRL